ncbi:MAG TPA: hypothetical protein VN083_07655, partial [Vicinamibacteria bacterium]|nr:hypothetical protein [Vicinamibacteria bacterium]
VSGTSETTRTLPTGRDAARSPVVPPRHLDPSVHPALEAVCLKALSANPAERYPGVVELGADVERFLGGLAVSAYPESLWARVWRVSIRHRTPILVILAYVVMRLLLLLLARV